MQNARHSEPVLTLARNDAMFLFVQSKQQFGSATEDAALIRPDVHQHNVRANPADTVPGNHKIVPGRAKTTQFALPRHYDGRNLSVWELNNHIPDKAQPPSVADTDDLFAMQIRELCRHSKTPFGESLCGSARGYE